MEALSHSPYIHCSCRFVKRENSWSHAALANSCSLTGQGLSREIRGRQSSIKRRRTCPTVFSREYHDQLSSGNGTDRTPVARSFSSTWATHKNSGQRRTP